MAARTETPEHSELTLGRISGQVANYVHLAVIDRRVIEALLVDGVLCPRESWLWDFKRDTAIETHERCELIKDVVALHNSHGGYLVIGVEERADRTFAFVGVQSAALDEAQLRAQIRTYTGAVIDVRYADVEVPGLPPNRTIGILFVPKRAQGTYPVVFQRNAANAPSGKLAFKEGAIVLRVVDESRPIAGRDDLAFLLGERVFATFLDVDRDTPVALPLPNTLPDKNVICPQFVGREEILEDLWRWLADPFSYLRVLAGDGGKGKTSIAYTFAIEFSIRHLPQFQQVVWLTAKKKQFSAIANQYVEMPAYQYSDVDSLLQALAEQCGVTEQEILDASTAQLKRLCRDALEILPALVVIDDVDSLDANDQRRVMEIAAQLASSRSRFLLTTRANHTHSNDVCVTVPGLSITDYEKFIEVLSSRLNIRLTGKNDIERLHAATSGSPLLTESIVRLVKQGMPVSTAIDEWRGQAGQDARNAALDKEIQRLSPEARRVLLCMSYLGECSLSELRHLTNYGQVKLADAIGELQSLFLVNAPVVTETEPRFAVPELVRLLAQEKRATLAADFQSILHDAREMKKGLATGQRGAARVVGAAIAQASAQLAQGRANDAARTIQAALQRYPNHPNLLCVLARCYMRMDPPRLNEARDLFKGSHDGGNKRPEVTDRWYQAECIANHWPGALHVANLVLEGSPGDAEWRYRRAYASSQIAVAREKSGDGLVSVLKIYEQAAEDLAVSIVGSRGVSRQERVDAARALNDLLWARVSGDRHSGPRDQFDVIQRAIGRGDYRGLMYARLLGALEAHVADLESILPESQQDITVRTMLKRAETALEVRPKFDSDEIFRRQFNERLSAIDRTYQSKLRKL